jgi:hypothetical protein
MTWKDIVAPGRPEMKIWRMPIAYWIPKAANTHSEYVTFIHFPRQQCFRQHASVLRSTYTDCLVFHISTMMSIVTSGIFVFFSVLIDKFCDIYCFQSNCTGTASFRVSAGSSLIPGVGNLLVLIYIFNCNWVDTRWQQYSSHLHTNSTQVNTQWQQYSSHLNTNSTQNTPNRTYITNTKLNMHNNKH